MPSSRATTACRSVARSVGNENVLPGSTHHLPCRQTLRVAPNIRCHDFLLGRYPVHVPVPLFPILLTDRERRWFPARTRIRGYKASHVKCYDHQELVGLVDYYCGRTLAFSM